jgi:hypothetical protein
MLTPQELDWIFKGKQACPAVKGRRSEVPATQNR